MASHRRPDDALELSQREGIALPDAIARLREEREERDKQRREARTMSAITMHVLDSRFGVLQNMDETATDSQMVAALDAYADAISEAPKLVLLGHQLRLIWLTLRRSDD